jgi:peroxin-1
VWVLGRTRIRFRVGKATLLQTVLCFNLKSQTPLVSTDPPSVSRAVLLSTDTEVSIAPKLRNGRNHPETKAKSSSQAPSNTSPDSSVGLKSSKPLAIGRPIVLRVLPSRLAVLPESPDELQDIIAYVSPSTLAGISNQDLPLASLNSTCSASIRRLKSPTALGISSIIDASASAAPPPVPPAAKLIQPKDGKVPPVSGTVPEPAQSDERVVLCCLSGIPEHHILLRGALPNLSDWDLAL